jgi:hypothetical protein
MKFCDTNTISRACHFHNTRAGCTEMDSGGTPQRDKKKILIYKMATTCARKQ